MSGGTEGCRTLYHELLTLEYSHFAYGSFHLFTTDAYVLQHYEDHGPRSNAFHLLRLCWLLEHGGSPKIGGGWPPVEGLKQAYLTFPFLEPPEDRGEVTVADMSGASGPGEYGERAWRWAESVWEAWERHHGWARQWFE